MDKSCDVLYLFKYRIVAMIYSSPTFCSIIIGCLRHSILTGRSDICAHRYPIQYGVVYVPH